MIGGRGRPGNTRRRPAAVCGNGARTVALHPPQLRAAAFQGISTVDQHARQGWEGCKVCSQALNVNRSHLARTGMASSALPRRMTTS